MPRPMSRLGERFSAPPSFNDPGVAPVIDGLTPKDAGYMAAWAKKNGVTFRDLTGDDPA